MIKIEKYSCKISYFCETSNFI